MIEIKFYVPKSETIPTKLRLYVGDTYVTYEQIYEGFRFYIYTLDEEKALKVAEEITTQMKRDHDEPQHGVSWVTVSLELGFQQEDRYRAETVVDWKYRVRDSF